MLLRQAQAEHPGADTGHPRYAALIREHGYPSEPTTTKHHGPPPTPLPEDEG